MHKLDPFLDALGWNDFFQSNLIENTHDNIDSLNEPLAPGRVISQGRGHYQLQVGADEILEAAITTKFHDAVTDSAGFPTVGDWVTFARGKGNHQATIHHVLRRKSLIQRRRSGAQQGMQLIAANVDYMLIVTSLDEDFNLERLGRYVALARDSSCTAAIVLTKADLCSNTNEYKDKVSAEFERLEVFTISSIDAQSITPLEKFFAPGKTSVLVGSSGVGKSTLTNHLLGFEAQRTQGLGADARGQHTTTARTLRFTRLGGLVIDTPGMQEISITDPGDEIEKNFSDIEESMLRCKFTNCQHKSEPGCAILAALKAGTLSADRWAQYLAMKAKTGHGPKKRSR